MSPEVLVSGCEFHLSLIVECLLSAMCLISLQVNAIGISFILLIF